MVAGLDGGAMVHPPEHGWTGSQIADRLWTFYHKQPSTRALTRLDFVEHVAYLLFLRLDHERAQRSVRFAARPVAPVDAWPRLTLHSGEELHRLLSDVMDELGDPRGTDPRRATARVLFHAAQPWNVDRMSELRKLIMEEFDPYRWRAVPREELGLAFSQMLADCRDDFLTKRQTGQILTPPPLLAVAARALALTPQDRVIDPAVGIGSSLIAAYREMSRHGDRVDAATIAGADIDPTMCRLATMNLLLNTGRLFSDSPPALREDSLKTKALALRRADPDIAASAAICNPPFKSSSDVQPDTTRRDDFWAQKADLPTNFLQHLAITLPQGARAAVFVPDGVLFGSGAAASVRRRLLYNCEVHTLLRLPTGIFYGAGTKSNILFFTKSAPKPTGEPATRDLWLYDARIGNHHTDTDNPLTEDDFADFLAAYRIGDPDFDSRTESERFRRYPVAELLAMPGANLDLKANIATELDDYGSPRDIALSIADNLQEAGRRFRTVAESLT